MASSATFARPETAALPGRYGSTCMPHLPQIEHPMSRLGDRKKLTVQGIHSAGDKRRPATSNGVMATENDVHQHQSGRLFPPLNSHSLETVPEDGKVQAPAVYPQELPASRAVSHKSHLRPLTQSAGRERTVQELESALREKFRTGSFYQIRHAFRTFDATGHGAVSKEALFRIIVNVFPFTSHATFRKLLERLGLDKKTAITFDDFYAQFRKQEPAQPKWLDPVSRHGPRFLTAFQVHQQLKEKARQKFVTMGELFPSGKLDGRVIKLELKSMLNQLSLPVDDEEFEKLWQRYDTEGRGVVQVEKLMAKLGIELKESTTQDSKTSFGKDKGNPGVKRFHDGKQKDSKRQSLNNGGSSDVENMMRSQLNNGFIRMKNTFEKVDVRKTGKVSSDELRQVLGQFGIKLSPHECSDLLTRCGVAGSNLFSYHQFLYRFLDRSEGSLTNAILTDPQHEFNYSNSKSTALTASAAESSLMNLLQGDFLSLLGTFQALDRDGTGAVSQKDFRTILEGHLKWTLTDTQFLHLLKDVHLTSDGLVLYAEFLSKFDRGNTRAIFPLPDERSQDEGRSIEEVEAYIRSTLKPHYTQIFKTLEELDGTNSGHLTQDLLWELFHRFQVEISYGEMSRLWPRFIKAANETLDFHEFMRHFGLKVKSAGVNKRQQSLGKRWTEDHCYQRSRTLHREEDMVEQSLKAKVTYYYSSVWKRFVALDPNGTGMVDKTGFQEVIQNLVPEMTVLEIDQLGKRYDPYRDGRVNYLTFLEPFKPSSQTYRVGNNLGSLLSHRSRDATDELKPVQLVAEKPTKGVPGLIGSLRNKIFLKWRNICRSFKTLDTSATGKLSQDEFSAVLKLSGIFLTEQELSVIVSEFRDAEGNGICYKEFLNTIRAT